MSDEILNAASGARFAIEMAEIVLPNDANPLGALWRPLDATGSDLAERWRRTGIRGSYAVTASVDHIDFLVPGAWAIW